MLVTVKDIFTGVKTKRVVVYTWEKVECFSQMGLTAGYEMLVYCLMESLRSDGREIA